MGTGMLRSAVPLISAMCWYRGTPAGQGSGPGRRQGHGENCIGAEFGLVVGAIGGNHGGIQLALGGGIAPQQQAADRAVDIGHRLQHALAQIAGIIAVAQLQRLTRAGGGPGGDAGRTDMRRNRG